MLEPRDVMRHRNDYGAVLLLKETILVKRVTGETASTNHPDAPSVVTRKQFKIGAEIKAYPIELTHKPGGLIRRGDYKVTTSRALIGLTGETDNPTLDTAADIVVWRGNTYVVHNVPSEAIISRGSGVWTATLRLLAQ